MTPYKLLLTTDYSPKIKDFTEFLAKELAENFDIEIMLFVIKNANNSDVSINTENVAKQHFCNVVLDDNVGEVSYRAAAQKIRADIVNVCGEFKPNLLHLNHYLDGSISYPAPQIVSIHKAFFNIKNQFLKNTRRKFNEIIYRSLSASTALVCSSRTVATQLFSSFRMRKPSKLIYNGINYPIYNDDSDSKLLTVNCDTQKELDLFSKFAYRLPKDFKVNVVSQYPLLSKHKNINVFNDYDDILEAYKNSAAYVAFSTFDLFGFSSMRAAFSNCAIIANDTPYYQEIWGDCAQFYEKNDFNSLLRQINNLIENQYLREKIAQRCHSKGISSFSSKRMGSEYINFYKKLISLSKREVTKNNQ